MLTEFYAVTATSVYHVTEKSDSGLYPAATKIALKGESQFPVGKKLEGGTLIAIGKFLLAFIPEKYGATAPMSGYERNPEQVNTRYWGDQSSGITALFLNREEAMECFDKDDREVCDPRWLQSTRKVLELIGHDHPAFVICAWPPLALIPTSNPTPSTRR